MVLRQNIIVICVFAFAVLGGQGAHAFPKPHKLMTSQEFLQLVPSGSLSAGNFRSIVALSNCSGSLVRFANSLDTDRAMILTNGHCRDGGFLKPNEVHVNEPTSRSFALLNDNGSRYATLRADRVLVSTMTKTDITLYGLTQTFAEIFSKYKVQALTISAQHPTGGTSIAVISGYWKRIYSCKIDKFIYRLHEGDWEWLDSVRYSTPGCQTIGGTSGSPIINTTTNEVIGVNNTGNDSGERCTEDNPCEIDENGNVTVIFHASYGQQTFWLYSCLNQQRQIDLNISNCALRP